jgi:hypothetical protein
MLNKLSTAIVLLLLCCGITTTAQELNCKVSIRHDKIQNVDQQVFIDMERAISTFINTRKWTTDEFSTTEKIECTIMFNLTAKLDGTPDGYSAIMNIQSTRPVYNTGYNSSMVNFIDRDVNFKFNQFSPITFDDNRVSGNDALSDNLSAVLAYYVYTIIGLDYDSYSMNGGNFYFKKAQNIVNNAPENKNVAGWKAVEGTKNRYWLIDQILSPRFAEFHKYWYTMHRLGFDNLYDKPNDARKNILGGISTLQRLNKENPNAILIQFFFNAKSNELINIVSDLPAAERQSYITQLSQTDVSNASKYQNLSKQ